MNEYDVAIIGAGIGGLVCGCYLAKSGLKTLIIEQHDKPGGYCTSFSRGGYRFDAGVHYFGGVKKRFFGNILKELKVDNAIKFNKEKGFVRISSEEINGKVKITIEDSGIGIPEKDIPRIFERFYRVDKARSRELGGTGLGLSIVKHIVELHGGSVGVESTEGLGSKFWFVLSR